MKNSFCVIVSFLFILLGCDNKVNLPSEEVVDTELHPVTESPYALLAEVPIDHVDITAGIWKDRFELVRNITIPRMFDYMNADTSSHWRNFLIADGQISGKWHGTYWHDGDFYKWLEAAAYVYQVTGDTALERIIDEVVEVIARVQAPDGYLHTYIQIQNEERWQNKQHHELYNLGHLMTAAARHYEATGKTNLLDVGRKTADYLYETFAVNRPARLNPFGFNPSNIMGAVDMYRVTGNQNYLALADTFVSMRGTTVLSKTIDLEEFMKHSNPPGDDNNQDRVPFRKETEAVGHAVTATYLYAGAADVYLETGEKALLDANHRLWDDVVMRKLGIHGGAGPAPKGVSIRNDKIHEAFDAAYILPLRVSYNETCANIGNVMWNWRMYKADPKVSYLEVMETGMYNSGLSGFGLDGFSFYYNNPLRRFGTDVPLVGGSHDRFQRSPYVKSYCCPPQLARHIAGFRHYLYSVSTEKPGLWVNFYTPSVVNTQLNNDVKVKLEQKTNYPWEGQIEINLGLEKAESFSLAIPIPSWAEGAKVKINGGLVNNIKAGEFLHLEREWENNDQVSIELPMRVRVMKANPIVEQTFNQVAVVRGPVVYCLESADLPANIDFLNVFLKRGASFTTEHKPDLLGGVTVVKTKALAVADDEWTSKSYNSSELYKEIGNEKTRELDIQLIPYFAWSNRGITEMTIWMPLRD